MDRKNIIVQWNEKGLDQAARLYDVSKDDLRLFGDYLGCQNLVYEYMCEDRDMILRISYREDRPLELVQAEVHFVNYLADHGVRVSQALPSRRGNLVELIQVEERQFIIVSFVKAKGLRVPDNQYRYRRDVSIDEYCQNWGAILGQMHCLAQQYVPPGSGVKRPEWLARWSTVKLIQTIPDSMPGVREKCQLLVTRLQNLPQDREVYGLIHADFNDGNFCVDYDNGNITVFDFDDASYGWYVYELASAWEGFTGRAMFEPDVGKRRGLMDHYFDQILQGYMQQYTLPSFWLDELPFFLKVIEMESLLERMAYFQNDPQQVSEVDRAEMDYLARCIEGDIPYLGMFDSIFNHKHPFRLIVEADRKG